MAITAIIAEQIMTAVSRRRQQLIDLTIAFCSIAAENPPGSGLIESQRWITETLARFDISFGVHDTSRADSEHRTIIGSVGSQGPIMYLHGHYDVVPAFDPGQFDPEVRGGSIYGRGTSDMKGRLVAMLIATLVHRESCGAGQVKLVYVPDDDTLYLGDTFFGDGVAEEMDPAEIGPLLFTVTSNSLDAMESCDWIPANGDSSLPIGAEVSELVSQDVSVAVVANYGGQFFVYWADRD